MDDPSKCASQKEVAKDFNSSPAMSTTQNAKAKSDIAFQAYEHNPSSAEASGELGHDQKPRAFTSHIPEENSAEYQFTDDRSKGGNTVN